MNEEEHIQELAKELVGNWKKFESFGWHDRPADADNWCIVYIKNRDSGLLEQSNYDAFESELKDYLGWHEDEGCNAQSESHRHWAIGYVDGFSIKVFNEKQEITDAFKAYAKLALKLEDYPVLDDEDYSKKEYEATIGNIKFMGSGQVKAEAPKDWPEKCFNWFWENDQSAVENKYDSGGYPSDEQIKECLTKLNLIENND